MQTSCININGSLDHALSVRKMFCIDSGTLMSIYNISATFKSTSNHLTQSIGNGFSINPLKYNEQPKKQMTGYIIRS